MLRLCVLNLQSFHFYVGAEASETGLQGIESRCYVGSAHSPLLLVEDTAGSGVGSLPELVWLKSPTEVVVVPWDG